MNLLELPPAVQNLASLGESWEKPAHWKDYRALGITAEHIPALIETIEHAETFWEDDTSQESWLPVHAWRALAQLQAGEAVPALIRLLPWIDENDNDIIQEDLPDVFGMIGPPACPLLISYLENTKNPVWARVAAAEGLRNIALQYSETRDVVINGLLRGLANYSRNKYVLNSFLILYLSYLKTTEGAPLVEQVLRSGLADEEITGDWEDYQIAVGLLENRLTPRNPGHPSLITFSDGLPETALDGPVEQSLAAAQATLPEEGTKKDRKRHLQRKHLANKDTQASNIPEKHKRKEAKPKRKKGGKKK